MKIGIVYETYSYTTEAVVGLMTSILSGMGHIVSISKIKDNNFCNKMLSSSDVVIFATPSWLDAGKEGQPHISFIEYMEENKNSEFSNLKCAFVGLGDKNYAHFCKGAEIIKDFYITRKAKNIATILKIDSYQFNHEEATSQIETWLNKITSSV